MRGFRFQFFLLQTHFKCAHGFQGTNRAAVTERQFSDFSFLPQVTIDAVLLDRHTEHLTGTGAVDILPVGEHLLPPILTSQPRDYPALMKPVRISRSESDRALK